jgi:hypothetical protein
VVVPGVVPVVVPGDVPAAAVVAPVAVGVAPVVVVAGPAAAVAGDQEDVAIVSRLPHPSASLDVPFPPGQQPCVARRKSQGQLG